MTEIKSWSARLKSCPDTRLTGVSSLGSAESRPSRLVLLNSIWLATGEARDWVKSRREQIPDREANGRRGARVRRVRRGARHRPQASTIGGVPRDADGQTRIRGAAMKTTSLLVRRAERHASPLAAIAPKRSSGRDGLSFTIGYGRWILESGPIHVSL